MNTGDCVEYNTLGDVYDNECYCPDAAHQCNYNEGCGQIRLSDDNTLAICEISSSDCSDFGSDGTGWSFDNNYLDFFNMPLCVKSVTPDANGCVHACESTCPPLGSSCALAGPPSGPSHVWTKVAEMDGYPQHATLNVVSSPTLDLCAPECADSHRTSFVWESNTGLCYCIDYSYSIFQNSFTMVGTGNYKTYEYMTSCHYYTEQTTCESGDFMLVVGVQECIWDGQECHNNHPCEGVDAPGPCCQYDVCAWSSVEPDVDKCMVRGSIESKCDASVSCDLTYRQGACTNNYMYQNAPTSFRDCQEYAASTSVFNFFQYDYDNSRCLYYGTCDGNAASSGVTVYHADCPAAAVLGCMDSRASNYNAAATQDDGSCTFQYTISIDMTPDNCGTADSVVGLIYDKNNGNTLIATETFTETPKVILLPSDNIYVEFETRKDGMTYKQYHGGYHMDASESLSATWSGEACILGCKDPTASNFNSAADEDDGSCSFSVVGCSTQSACNFDSSVTSGDDSCIYADTTKCESCSGETDGTGTIVGSNGDKDECGVCNGSNQPSTGWYCKDGGQSLLITCSAGYEESVPPTPTSDRECAPILCNIDHRVNYNQCVPCTNGFSKPAGDNAALGDTECICAAGKGVHGGVCRDCVNKEANQETTITAPCVDQTCPEGFGVIVDGFNNALEHTASENCENCTSTYGDMYISPQGSGVCILNIIPGCTNTYACNFNPDANTDDGSCSIADSSKCETCVGIIAQVTNDADGDGTCDDEDNCDDDPNKSEPGQCGCGHPDTDTDGDGTPDCNDDCPNDPNKSEAGQCGCGNLDGDTDGDGIHDCNDECPNDPNEVTRGQCGCGNPETDTDGDGTPDCNDECPNDPNEVTQGQCGCGNPETDTDGDGTADCNDECPNDPNKSEAGQCGCGKLDGDTDGDGTHDCNDECPSDPNEVTRGQCGCGNPETDTDGDGTPDCTDECPNDPNDVTQGQCGCGNPETDTDGDGVPDCIDTDDDNDGWGDDADAFPLDSSESKDNDGDGIGNNADAFPNDPNESVDTDGDGVGDNEDVFPDDPTKSCSTGLVRSNNDCLDCDGVVNGNKVVDQCGHCGGDGTSCEDLCGVPYGNNDCLDCDGVPNGNKVVDQCGHCGGDGTSCEDQCGVPNGDNSCLDCDGVPNGNKVVDQCGHCGGDGSSCMCTAQDIACEHGTQNGIIPSCGCTCDRGYEGDLCERKVAFLRPDTTCDSVGTLCARKKKQLKPTVVCPNHRCTTEVCCEDLSPETCQDAGADFCTRVGRVNKADMSNTCAKFPCTVKECCDAPTRGCKTGNHCNTGTFDIHDESKCFSCYRGTCSNKRCVCPDAFGGTKCNVRISKGAQQGKVKDIRASFSGNSEDVKKQRHSAYKALVQDIVRAKIAEGVSVREAVKEYTLPIAKVDLPLKTAAVVTKTPAIASVPDNADQDDDCHLGTSATNCGMVDLKDDRDNNQQTIVSVGDYVGSWAVVVDAGTIISKQTRTGEDTYDMQCWNGEWEAAEEKTFGDVFECNNRVIFIGSQIGICDETTCLNGGTCVAAGDSFTCSCTILWEGQFCEIPKTAGNDGTSATCIDAFNNVDKIAFQNLNCACASSCLQ